jgi:hypothetical protein
VPARLGPHREGCGAQVTERKTVRLAYVTRWAATRGIVVVMDAEVYRPPGATDGREYLTKHGTNLFEMSGHWTDNLDVAERRWREAVKKAHKAAQKKAKALGELLKGPAQYEKGKA